MLEALAQYFPPEVTWTRPLGGLFLWVTLPMALDGAKLFEAALRENVAFVPGDSFYAPNGNQEGARRHLRLNFSSTPPDQIREGIRRLSVAVKMTTGRSAGHGRDALIFSSLAALQAVRNRAVSISDAVFLESFQEDYSIFTARWPGVLFNRSGPPRLSSAAIRRRGGTTRSVELHRKAHSKVVLTQACKR